jgi:hypothetical protein
LLAWSTTTTGIIAFFPFNLRLPVSGSLPDSYNSIAGDEDQGEQRGKPGPPMMRTCPGKTHFLAFKRIF